MSNQDKRTENRTPATTGNAEGAGEIMEEGNDLGSIRIHNNVIAVIARLAALKVPGVVGLSSSLAEGLAGMITKKALDHGIRVDVEDQSVVVNLSVELEYGVRIPEVTWRLQNDVRDAVEQMTGKHVEAVHIVVQSVRLPEEKRTDREEAQTT